VYLDSSVALAHVLGESVAPRDSFWSEPRNSSRLIVYETWTALHRGGLAESHATSLRQTLARVAVLELIEPIVGAGAERHPGVLRTLDALHLASLRFLVEESQGVRLATYDRRLASAATATGIELYPL
jgi:predicted nucleic acid-binding protein